MCNASVLRIFYIVCYPFSKINDLAYFISTSLIKLAMIFHYLNRQISPFPLDLVKKEAEKYPNATIAWVQEEPKNMGSWFYVQPRIVTATSNTRDVK